MMFATQGIHPQDGRGINLHNMLIISLALHVAILSSSAFLQISSTPKLTFGPVYSVQLVSTPSSYTEPSAVSSLSKDIMSASSRERAIVIKKQSDDITKIPIRRMESTASRNPQIDQALDRLKKKMAAETPTSDRNAATTDRPTSSAEGNARFNDYYRAIWSKIKSQWALPGGILPKGGLEATVHVRILRNGSLTDIGLEKRSGNTYFDNSALRAVNKSNPLPPLPDWFKDSSLDVGIRFHSSDLL